MAELAHNGSGNFVKTGRKRRRVVDSDDSESITTSESNLHERFRYDDWDFSFHIEGKPRCSALGISCKKVLSIESKSVHVCIDSVDRFSWAEELGVTLPSEILEVDGEKIKGMRAVETFMRLQQLPRELRIGLGKPRSEANAWRCCSSWRALNRDHCLAAGAPSKILRKKASDANGWYCVCFPRVADSRRLFTLNLDFLFDHVEIGVAQDKDESWSRETTIAQWIDAVSCWTDEESLHEAISQRRRRASNNFILQCLHGLPHPTIPDKYVFEVVGCLNFFPKHPDCLYISKVKVSKPHTRHGVATLLYESMCSYVRDSLMSHRPDRRRPASVFANITKVCLDVLKGNDVALQVYKKLGFVTVNESPVEPIPQISMCRMEAAAPWYTLELEDNLASLHKRLDASCALDANVLDDIAQSLQKQHNCNGTCDLLETLIAKCRANDAQTWTNEQLVSLLYSLSNHRQTSSTQRFIAVVTKHLQAQTTPFRVKELVRICYGLRLHGSCEETLNVWSFISHHMANLRCELDGEAIACCAYSLQGHVESDTTHRYLSVLASKIEQSKAVIFGQHVGSALYGLRYHTSSVASRAVLKVIAKKIEARNVFFCPRSISMALFGLQNHEASDESLTLLKVIAAKIKAEQWAIDIWCLGNCLHGLQKHGSCVVSRTLLQAIGEKLELSSSHSCFNAISMALYGLNRHSSSSESFIILAALANVIEETSEEIWPYQAARALCGLRNHVSSEATRAVLRALAWKISKMKEDMDEANLYMAQSSLENHAHTKEGRAVLVTLQAKQK